MKTTILTMTFLAFLSTAGLTGCNFTTEQKAETLEEAKANVEEASADLDQARLDSAEYANYKVETEIKLRSNGSADCRYERQNESRSPGNTRLVCKKR